MTTTYLSIGSNEGDRGIALEMAKEQLILRVGEIMRSSRVYETESWGHVSTDYLNQCVSLETTAEPKAVLDTLKEIEQEMGREHTDSSTYTSRPIDLDILLYGTSVVQRRGLTIPHPRLHERLFVLRPLCDIAPDLVHPVFGSTMADLLANCPDLSRIVIYE